MGKEEFERLVRSFHRYFSEEDETRISLGFETGLEGYGEPTVEQQEYDLKRSKRMLRRFKKCPKRGLTFDQKLDLELAKFVLKQDIFDSTYKINGIPSIEVIPGGGDIGDSIYTLFINDPRPPEERLNNIVARMENTPEYLKKHLKVLKTPVSRWIKMDFETIDELPSMFNSIYQWAEQENYSQLDRLERAQKTVMQALKDFKKGLRAKQPMKEFAMGEKQAREWVKLIGIDMSFEEMQRMATNFLAETREELAELRHKLVTHYKLPQNTSNNALKSYLDHAYAVPLEGILDHYHKDFEEVMNFIDRLKLFDIPKSQEIKFVQTPKYLEGQLPAGAMDMPRPFRRGRKTSIVYLTIRKDRITEHTKIKIPSMIIHEGIPGHHLQYVYAYSNPSIVRRHIDPMDWPEAWATMMEDHMLDQGFMENWTDETRFISKMDLARLGARVGIDLYFMTGNIEYLDIGVNFNRCGSPFVNAARLLRKVTGFSPSRIEAEIDWYSLSPGYPLSYLVGNKMVWQLKEDFAEAQKSQPRGLRLRGPKLDRKFHEVYLTSGCMPLKYLRKVFEHKGLLEKR